MSLAHDVRGRLLDEMRAGSFRGGRLPPEADLARKLGVSRATVRAALQTLAEDGIVSRRRRHGTVVNEQMLRGTVPLNRLLSFRERLAAVFEAAAQRARDRLAAPPQASAHRYQVLHENSVRLSRPPLQPLRSFPPSAGTQAAGMPGTECSAWTTAMRIAP